MKKLFSYLFTLFLLAPVALAAQLTISDRFVTFVNGFRGLPLNLNSAALVSGLIAILPVVGLVVIVFGLMFFVTKISIFKSPDHDKYARMIAWGVALIGLAQQSVYNTILNLSTTFLILVFILAVIFIFIMFTNHSRKAHLTSHAQLHKITGDALGARRDLEKIKHELKHEKALYTKTEQDLQQLDSDLNNISHLVGNELDQVDKIAQMLRKATAAHQSGNSPATNEYVKALSKDMAGLITTMQHEQKHEIHLSEMVSKIEAELAKWGHSADKEKSDEEHLQKLFHKFSEGWGHKIKSEELTELYKEEKVLIHQLKDMRNHLHSLQALYDKIIASTENLEKASYQRKHLEASAVRDNIMAQQFAEAHKHLDNLRAIIEYEPHVIKQLRSNSSEMHHLLSRIDEEEKRINQLIQSKMIIALKRLREKSKNKDASEKHKKKEKKDKERKQTRAFLNVRNRFEGAIHDIMGNISIVYSAIHGERKSVQGSDKRGNPIYHEDPAMMSLVHQLHTITSQLSDWGDKVTRRGADLIEVKKHFLSYWHHKQHYLNDLHTQLPQDKRRSREAAKTAAKAINEIIHRIEDDDFLKDFEKTKPDADPYDGQRTVDIDHTQV